MVAFVQQATGSVLNSLTPVSATLGATPTEGNLLVAVHHARGGTVTTPTGWSVARKEDAAGAKFAIFYKVAGASESATLSIDVGVQTHQSLTLMEWSGLLADQGTVLDVQTGQNTNQTAVATYGTGTSGATTAPGLAIATVGIMGAPDLSGSAWTATAWTNGFTGRTAFSSGAGSSPSAQSVGSKEVAAATTVESTETWSANRRAAGIVAVFAAEESDPDLLDHAVVGATTDSGATVAAKVPAAASVRLAVSTSSDLSSPTYFGPATADASGIVKVTATGLTASTGYYFGVEIDSALSPTTGQFTTMPAEGSQASFTFGSSSCAQGIQSGEAISVHPVFDRIADADPLFFLHLGDLAYPDIATNDVSLYESFYEQVFGSAKQGLLWRTLPLFYTWDDHDYGPDNGDKDAAGRPAALATYRRYIPHPTLAYDTTANDDPIHYTFTVGRVRFIIPDTRSARDAYNSTASSSKTVCGTVGRQWVLDQLAAAEADPDVGLVVFSSGTPWVYVEGDPGAAATPADSWGNYTHERDIIGAEMAAMDTPGIIVAGDMHGIAYNDGTESVGGWPAFQSAALQKAGASKGGPWTGGPDVNTDAFQGQWGLFTITDNGSTIDVAWSGREVSSGGVETELLTYSFEAAVPAAPTSGLSVVGGTLTAVGGTLTSA